ncbi:MULTISPECIES: ImmA/IrrE family metallo-endopeptidase [Brucella/Ochrobactrum group]|uniref:ImmA/IrrE family metallo-endopeptidase n=1 Tax=Ochrobactrum teleogrylli TaxID=2479765 RepID=A0ABD5K3W9_9HYPH|nr:MULTISPECIES: ImmA/IrrE family metallo-endopeptidase [Brucella/Ochrobactrum group]MBA8845732.1 Zn-dependent peptidase ImmA (M78 family)/plasmid maintenance system antidote protein VapI [Ochrobactrum sp. RH1CCR137]MBA8857453.1 Zn-dependent peptidase ImmA (M78 family)/plasmid maintenance system antidote protein VapI [Ochrobactrum sp. RH1CCR134]UXO86236.1 ImmA/IrrE family metallo-endopeptidase [Brucella intermedia]
MNHENATANWFSKPGDSIRTTMQRRNVTVHELAERFEDGIDTVRGLIDGSRPIDESIATTLSAALGASVKFWLKRQEKFEEAVDRAVAQVQDSGHEDLLLRLPAPGEKVRGKMSLERRATEIRKRLVFYNVPDAASWSGRYGRLVGETDYRISKAFATKEDATLLWLRRGELEADMIQTRAWNSGNLMDRLKEIRRLSMIRHPQLFLPRLKTLCAEAGVALVVVKAPTGCRASGAVRMVDPDKAMLLLSFRYKRDDQFWFTLFHEIGHLVLHKANTFLEDESQPGDIDRENEANEFAAECIIPPLRESEFRRIEPKRDDIVRFSVSIGVAPGLTVGQMQHRQMLQPDKLNYLKRTWDWSQIKPATV